MFCVFFSIDGIIARIVVQKGQNITGKYYANHVLPKVFENFKQITNVILKRYFIKKPLTDSDSELRKMCLCFLLYE